MKDEAIRRTLCCCTHQRASHLYVCVCLCETERACPDYIKSLIKACCSLRASSTICTLHLRHERNDGSRIEGSINPPLLLSHCCCQVLYAFHLNSWSSATFFLDLAHGFEMLVSSRSCCSHAMCCQGTTWKPARMRRKWLEVRAVLYVRDCLTIAIIAHAAIKKMLQLLYLRKGSTWSPWLCVDCQQLLMCTCIRAQPLLKM